MKNDLTPSADNFDFLLTLDRPRPFRFNAATHERWKEMMKRALAEKGYKPTNQREILLMVITFLLATGCELDPSLNCDVISENFRPDVLDQINGIWQIVQSSQAATFRGAGIPVDSPHAVN